MTSNNEPQQINAELVSQLDGIARGENADTAVRAVMVFYASDAGDREGCTEAKLYFPPGASFSEARLGTELPHPVRAFTRIETATVMEYTSNPTCYYVIINGRPYLICF